MKQYKLANSIQIQIQYKLANSKMSFDCENMSSESKVAWNSSKKITTYKGHYFEINITTS